MVLSGTMHPIYSERGKFLNPARISNISFLESRMNRQGGGPVNVTFPGICDSKLAPMSPGCHVASELLSLRAAALVINIHAVEQPVDIAEE